METVILWIFCRTGGIFRNAGTFSKGIFYSWTHVCIFAPVHELLEYARTLRFGPILVRWRQNLWGFPPLWRFVLKCSDLPHFLLHQRTAFFETHPIKNLASSAQKLQGFRWTPLYHCYTLQNARGDKQNLRMRVHSLVIFLLLHMRCYVR